MTDTKNIYYRDTPQRGDAVSTSIAIEACQRWPSLWKDHPWTDAEIAAGEADEIAELSIKERLYDELRAQGR